MTFVARRGHALTPEVVSLSTEVARHAALAIDNARLYREAQEADQRKDEFLAMLGHELRNPIARWSPRRGACSAATATARARSAWPRWWSGRASASFGSWTTSWTCPGSLAARSRSSGGAWRSAT